MPAKLAVTVAVEMDAATVTLRPAGSLTPENVHGLLAVARRARHVLPGFDVRLDLDQLRAGSPEVLRALSESGAPIPPGHARDGNRPDLTTPAAA
jgi:hypothetical protein